MSIILYSEDSSDLGTTAMRHWVSALLMGAALGGVSAAHAADLDEDFLRGPQYDAPALGERIDWSGIYVGAHGGYTSSSFGFTNTAQPVVANYLRATVAEAEMNASGLLSTRPKRAGGPGYGAYAGFNLQFDEIVVGAEVDFTHLGFGGQSYDEIGRMKTTSDGYLNVVRLSSLSRTEIQDFGTIRARAGYAFGSLMPYTTAGVAIGSARVLDRVSVQHYGYDVNTYKANLNATGAPAYVNNYGYAFFNQSNPGDSIPDAPYVYQRSKTKTVAGVALGTGLEFALTSSIVLRGEYQYVLFDSFDGHKANINTVRGGVSAKF